MDIETMLRSAGLLDEVRGVEGSVSDLIDQVLVLRHERSEAIKALGAGSEVFVGGRLDIAASISQVKARSAGLAQHTERLQVEIAAVERILVDAGYAVRVDKRGNGLAMVDIPASVAALVAGVAQRRGVVVLEFEREVDGRWIAEVKGGDGYGCMAYGATREDAAMNAIRGAEVLRGA